MQFVRSELSLVDLLLFGQRFLTVHFRWRRRRVNLATKSIVPRRLERTRNLQRKDEHPLRHHPARTSSSSSSSTSSKPSSAEAQSSQLQHRPWSLQGPVYIGETFQDPEHGTIIRVVRSSNGSRLTDALNEVEKKWSNKTFCCKNGSCRICAAYCRTTRANLCVSVVKSMRKSDKPNGPKFKRIVDDILRNR